MALTKEMVRDRMKEKSTVVLDVLGSEAYQKLHIKGSDNLPLGDNPSDFTKAVESRYGKDKFFITYCAGYDCSAGPNAAKVLKDNGFRAEDYPGGIKEWSESGFPSEGSMATAA